MMTRIKSECPLSSERHWPKAAVFLTFCCGFAAILLLPLVPMAAQEEAPEPARKKMGKGKSGKGSESGKYPPRHPGPEQAIKGSLFENLSDKERKELKEALSAAWNDPVVISARNDVKVAAENYKKAILTAVKEKNPKLGSLMTRAQADAEGSVKKFIGDRPYRAGLPGGGEKMQLADPLVIGPPGFTEKLSSENRKKLLAAHEKARTHESVEAALEEVKSLREKDEEFRKKRQQAWVKVRRSYIRALIEIDPSLEKALPRPEDMQARPGPAKTRPGPGN